MPDCYRVPMADKGGARTLVTRPVLALITILIRFTITFKAVAWINHRIKWSIFQLAFRTVLKKYLSQACVHSYGGKLFASMRKFASIMIINMYLIKNQTYPRNISKI